MKTFEELGAICERTSRISKRVVDDFLLSYAAGHQGLEKKMEREFQPETIERKVETAVAIKWGSRCMRSWTIVTLADARGTPGNPITGVNNMNREQDRGTSQ